MEQEIIKLLTREGGWQLIVTALIALGWWQQNRSYSRSQQVNADGQAKLITIIADFQKESADNRRINQETVEAFKGTTAQLVALKTCTDESAAMVAGFRREVQGIHATQLEKLNNLLQAVEVLPDATAQAVSKEFSPGLQAMRDDLKSAADLVDQACKRLAQWGERAAKSEARPEPSESNEFIKAEEPKS